MISSEIKQFLLEQGESSIEISKIQSETQMDQEATTDQNKSTIAKAVGTDQTEELHPNNHTKTSVEQSSLNLVDGKIQDFKEET